MTTRMLAPAAALCALFALSLPARAQCRDGLLLSGTAPAGAGLGESLDVSGGFAFAGATLDTTHGTNAGSVSVFEYGPTGFVERQKLFPPSPMAFDHFGQSLAADGPWLVVGTQDNVSGLSPGAGVVYPLDNGSWRWSQTLSAPGVSPFPYVGDSVAIEGERIALGAPGLSNQVGAVYVFELQAGAWVPVATVQPQGAQIIRGFGCEVALSGDRMIVGATFVSGGGLAPGAAFVFELQQGVWVQTARLIASDAHWSDVYGQCVDLDGDTAVVTGWWHDSAGGRRGAVWIFEHESGSWSEAQKLVGTPIHGSRFGFSADLDGDRLLVGATSDGGWFPTPSFAELFRRGAQGFQSELVVPGPSPTAGIGFGTSVHLWGDSMLVGNPTGSETANYAGHVLFKDLPRVETLSYCTATTNSTGQAAHTSLACPGILEERLLLRAAPTPPGSMGLFLLGSTNPSVPMFDGIRCVGGISMRRPLVFELGGELADDVDLAAARALGLLAPGSTWYAQAWFRDSAAGGTGSNLSSGLELIFAP